MSDPQTGKRRRRLVPSEKYELFVQILTQQATQREAAANWGVDRSTAMHICRVAKQGALDVLTASVPGDPPGRPRPSRSSWPRPGPRSSDCVRRSPSRP